ncbi:MAG: autotransporter assembly complex family protein [Pseudohongiellaceae bacterium]
MNCVSPAPPPGRTTRSIRRRLATVALLLAGWPLLATAQSPTIRIEGADQALTSNIRAHLRIDSERCDVSLRRLDRLLPQVRRNVERAAQALGYYHLEQSLQFSTGEECWELVVDVTPGEPVIVDTVEILIPEELRPLFRDARQNTSIRPGSTLNHGAYERLKTNLTTAAIENGFFDARFNRSQLNIDATANTAEIILDFEPGERYRFGEVEIGETEALSEEFIGRFVPFEQDEPYSAAQLATLRENLNGSQYFQQVTVAPQLSRASNRRVPVAIAMTPRVRRSYTAGAGISTDAGPRLRLAYEDRYINRQGHRLNADLTLSTQRQEPSVSYIIPLENPARDSLRLSGGFQREEADSYSANAYRVGISHRHTYDNNWSQTVFTNFQHERAVVAGSQEQTNTTVSGVNWSRTRADDPIYPQRGWRLFGQISGANKALLSDTTFLQLHTSAKYIRPLGSGRLLLRGEVASTVVDETAQLPVSERFFTGGDQSVRGHAWNSLGARDDEGNVVGGKNLLVTSVEFDFPVWENWNAAVFYDAGNSFNDFGTMTLRDSAGVGIRWLSPIGSIRADIARTLDDGSFRFHLTMGPDL